MIDSRLARAIVEAIELLDMKRESFINEIRERGDYAAAAAIETAVAFRKQSRMAFNGEESRKAWDEAEWRLRQLDTRE